MRLPEATTAALRREVAKRGSMPVDFDARVLSDDIGAPYVEIALTLANGEVVTVECRELLDALMREASGPLH
jgi:hypothetical protein